VNQRWVNCSALLLPDL